MNKILILTIVGLATSTFLGGCISVKRETKPETVTTRTSTSSSLLTPSTTTVQRTTTE